MGREEKVEMLREDVVGQLEDMLTIKKEEVRIIQEQLALLSKGHVAETKMTDPYGDTGVYTGQAKDDKPHGKGTMQYDDGRVYEGGWNQGRWHGVGVATFTNGDSYKGDYSLDQRNGEGEYRWADGRVYKGCFSNDLRQGKGRYTWPDGASYEGEFREGQVCRGKSFARLYGNIF